MTDYTHYQATSLLTSMDRARPAPPMNKKQKAAIIILDIVMIIQVAVAIGFAGSNPDEFTPVFFKVFFTMFIPTVIIGFMVIRRIKTPADDHYQQTEEA
jgi:membrane protein CcdC involved in cytochrome C biogenesis